MHWVRSPLLSWVAETRVLPHHRYRVLSAGTLTAVAVSQERGGVRGGGKERDARSWLWLACYFYRPCRPPRTRYLPSLLDDFGKTRLVYGTVVAKV